MTTYTQQPGSMNLSLRRGDEFGTVISFDVSLTGYTVTASLTSLVSGATVLPITTTLVDATAGQVGIALSEAQTAALAVGTYGWQLIWVAPGAVQRTALSGTVEVTA